MAVLASVTAMGLLVASGPRAALVETAEATAARGRTAHGGGTVATVGKLVTELGDGQYGACSGAIVDSPSGSVVATAAHCVTAPDSPREPVRAWFAPEYDRVGPQQALDEGWRVLAFHTPSGWDAERTLAEILPHDYAFVTVEKRDGRSIKDTYGANTLDFEPIGREGEVVPLGYPVNPTNGRAPLASCAGEVEVLTEATAHTANVGGLLLTGCDELTQGASGGPWLRDLDSERGTGRLVGVMSVGSGDGEVLARPFPERQGRKLLDRADAAAR
ncbi:trypsin-like peptidase domain-containing protein [Streptomyces sp. XM4193]|uniref:trypsin-like serine peptidase n=1 Tax=Streptomyces sp. XM4193 TaxID=2929782 RepID=UPI001FF71A6F|nr:trypsin-like peptidase domain-containing protein [Streptomyces sp. XM4193]MCK1794835.1 trypsin-like peptidase domain-containing protein [Streptomyces sp. XM4193]